MESLVEVCGTRTSKRFGVHARANCATHVSMTLIKRQMVAVSLRDRKRSGWLRRITEVKDVVDGSIVRKWTYWTQFEKMRL